MHHAGKTKRHAGKVVGVGGRHRRTHKAGRKGGSSCASVGGRRHRRKSHKKGGRKSRKSRKH